MLIQTIQHELSKVSHFPFITQYGLFVCLSLKFRSHDKIHKFYLKGQEDSHGLKLRVLFEK